MPKLSAFHTLQYRFLPHFCWLSPLSPLSICNISRNVRSFFPISPASHPPGDHASNSLFYRFPCTSHGPSPILPPSLERLFHASAMRFLAGSGIQQNLSVTFKILSLSLGPVSKDIRPAYCSPFSSRSFWKNRILSNKWHFLPVI